jgi:hypothetical protein
MKELLIVGGILLTIAIGCVNNENTPCPSCFSPTFEVNLLDATGSKLNGFNIKVINAQNDTLSVVDTSYTDCRLSPDTTYEIFWGNGMCKLIISNSKYETIEIDSMSISYGRCGVNPRILKIQPELNNMAKVRATSYRLLFDSTGRGCGN